MNMDGRESLSMQVKLDAEARERREGREGILVLLFLKIIGGFGLQ